MFSECGPPFFFSGLVYAVTASTIVDNMACRLEVAELPLIRFSGVALPLLCWTGRAIVTNLCKKVATSGRLPFQLESATSQSQYDLIDAFFLVIRSVQPVSIWFGRSMEKRQQCFPMARALSI